MIGLSIVDLIDLSDGRIKTIAILYFTVGILHGLLDPGISYLGIEVLGKGWEANPIMRASMQKGLAFFVLIHIPLYLGLFIAYLFTIFLVKREFRKGDKTVYYLTISGLMILIGWGLWLNFRNILVLAIFAK